MNAVIKTGIVTLFALGLSSVAVTATAAQGKDKKDWPSFRKADADNNGAISQDEARSVTGLGDSFAQYDKNSDGQLSRSEYESAKKAQPGSAGRSGAQDSSGASGSAGSPSGAGTSGNTAPSSASPSTSSPDGTSSGGSR